MGLPIMVLEILMETVTLQRAARSAIVTKPREGNLLVTEVMYICVCVYGNSRSNTTVGLDKYQ